MEAVLPGEDEGLDGDEGPPLRGPGFARAAARRTGRRVRTWVSPRVEDELVPGEGEFVVDEVTHHWVLALPRVAEVLGAVGLFALVATPQWPRVVGLPGLVLVAHAAWRALADHKDRFVITNLRVFRVQGVISRRTATMPIQRILDITVTIPVLGRLLGYGHFVFESAAQSQGLRDVRFIGSPHERDLVLQRVIQRSGLRRGLERYRKEDLPDPGRPVGRRATDPWQEPAGREQEDAPDPLSVDGRPGGPGAAGQRTTRPTGQPPAQRTTRPSTQRSSRRRRVGFRD